MKKRSARSRAKAPEIKGIETSEPEEAIAAKVKEHLDAEPPPEPEALVYGVWFERNEGFHSAAVHIPKSVILAAIEADPDAQYWPAVPGHMAIAQVVKDIEERISRRGL